MKSEKSISINQGLRCARVYPREGSTKSISDLKTLTLELTSEQAREFGSALCGAGSLGVKTIKVVAFREPEKNGTHRLAVRGLKKPPSKPRGSRTTGQADF